ncbi:ankyrin repeat domain-containing protein [Cupriavidus metallidurans]|uniref:ankyrin repeat domain-containing protein n=1 Tax=Cupriavidus metallidurans TaxID=119219 RepID=UPI001F3E336E|nr:ankyrin repeat domain-containing protein [Cupriavidus metallidurans]
MLEADGAIAHAAMAGNLAIVELLLTANKNPNESLPANGMAHDGYTPLMWATNRKYIPIVKALLQAGADVNAVASDGTTAVMLTADAKPTSLEVLEILCAYLPDVTRKDWRGRSVIDEARDRYRCSGRPEMREVLERHYPHIDFDSV